MVSKATSSLIMFSIVVIILVVFFLRFDGFKRLQDLFGGIGKAFGSKGDSAGGGETTIIVTESTSAETTDSGVSSANAPSEVIDTGPTVTPDEGIEPEEFDFQNFFETQLVANVSGFGKVTLEEAQGFLSDQGFENLVQSLQGKLDIPEEEKTLELEKQIQEDIATAVGVEQFGAAFGSPLGAFANPDFFTDEEKAEVGFIDPVTEPTQAEIQEQKITELEKAVQDALALFEKTGEFVLP